MGKGLVEAEGKEKEKKERKKKKEKRTKSGNWFALYFSNSSLLKFERVKSYL